MYLSRIFGLAWRRRRESIQVMVRKRSKKKMPTEGDGVGDMDSVPRSRTSGEFQLRENIVREALRNMYNAFDSTVNSHLIMEKIPGEIAEDEFKGDDNQRRQMRALCGWLHTISLLTKNDEVYQSTFLDPVRAAAHARLRMAGTATRSTSLEALVFACKPYYDSIYKVTRTMMSVVAPSLQAAMTVSVTSRDKKDSFYGYHVFDHCQPIPLVNRIHQTVGNVQQSTRQINLGEFDYLYTALDDIHRLSRSLEMESFCEVPSTSTDEDRRLAAPFVTFGKVVWADGPSVRVQQLDGSGQVTMMAVDQVSTLSGSPPESFEGKPVRILGVQWYEPSGKQNLPPEHPAIYCIEASNNVDTLRIQEECGRIRIRGSVHPSKIPADLRVAVTKLRCIHATEKSVSYVYRQSSDTVVSYFLDAQSKIRGLRTAMKINAVQVTEDQVIDQQKSGVNGLAKLIMSQDCRGLRIALMDFVAQNDIYREYGENVVCKALEMTPEQRRRRMSFLRYLGIMKREREDDWSLTKKGKGVAMSVALKLADGIPSTDLPAVMSPDTLVDKCIPPSLALNIIRNGELGKYEPGRINGTATETQWINGNAQAKAAEESRAFEIYTSLKRRVLAIMGSRDNPLAAAKIADIQGDRSRASTFTIHLLLTELSKAGKVKLDGDTWEYPVMMRVSDLFDRAGGETIHKDDVVKMINVATSPARRSEVDAAVDALVMDGRVSHRGHGFINSDYMRAKKDELKHEVIELFNREKAELLYEGDVVKKIKGGAGWEPEIRALIDTLVLDGIIVQIEHGKFTHNSEIKSKKDTVFRAKLKKVAMGMFTGEDVEYDVMIDALVDMLDSDVVQGDHMVKATYVRSVLNEMEDDDQIWLNGNRYVKCDA